MVSKEEAKEKIQRLIDKYKKIVDSGKIKEYHEERTKTEFIEPLFRALGWDIHSDEREDEVIKEDKVFKGRVDYAFRLNGTLKFFLEAKSLKGALDEEKSSVQAIDYAYHKKVSWAVVCDFESIRVYNSQWRGKKLFERRFLTLNTTNYIENFDKLWWLSREGFENGLLDKEADVIGKRKLSVPIDQQLLSDFMLWRKSLFDNIMKNALRHVISTEKVEEVVQNILDRLIFIRTCEDRGLEEKVLWQALIESKGSKKSLLHHLREVFTDFDEKYNSKLFVKNEADGVNIDDVVLKDIIHGLYESRDEELTYDFSLIDADILGSIYEQYLGHIMKQMPKRTKLKENGIHKKEQGIYYTPTYVVDYIIKNTLGELLKTKNHAEIEKLKVLDPACGSGSFLIKAFQLLEEDIKKRNEQEPISKNQILKNNIFGVDLDPKAVEITQLNLLLKAADKRIRLPNLQKNIKCGNSLINDPQVARERAFKWEEQFSEIMKEGGFDVIIGNPPYIRIQTLDKKHVDYFNTKYESATKNYDICLLFVEKGLSMLKEGGILGFILPSKFLNSNYGIGLRKTIINKGVLHKLVHFKDYQIFDGATTYTCLLFLKKVEDGSFEFVDLIDKEKFNLTKLINSESFESSKLKKPTSEGEWNFICKEESELMNKLLSVKTRLKDITERISQGFKTGNDKIFVSTAFKFDKSDERLLIKVLKGEEIRRYGIIETNRKAIFPYLVDSKDFKYLDEKDLVKFKSVYNYLDNHKKELLKRDNGKINKEQWFLFSRNQFISLAKKKKLITRDISQVPSFTYDENGEYGLLGGYGITLKKGYDYEYVLGLLNSKISYWFIKKTSTLFRGGFYSYEARFIENIPIRESSDKQKEIIKNKVKKIIEYTSNLQKIKDKQTDERVLIEKEIQRLDNEIDEEVYKLYGITKEEKKIIEESLK